MSRNPIRILSVRWSDDGNITIDWVDETAMTADGGTIHSTYLTAKGQGADPQVEYYVAELTQDVDELLGHARKLVEP